jgi:hypothetical protein
MVLDDDVIRGIGNGADDSKNDPEHDGSDSIDFFRFFVQVFTGVGEGNKAGLHFMLFKIP